MSKIAVVYHSKHGSTETYAKWIAEETGATLYREKECSFKDLEAYDVIVYGGAVHAGGIGGIKLLQKNSSALKDKKIIVFAVGLSLDDEKNQKDCRDINFVKGLEDVPCFFLKGAYDPEKVKGIDKAIMGAVKKMVDHSSQLHHDITHGADYVDKEQIEPILAAL